MSLKRVIVPIAVVSSIGVAATVIMQNYRLQGTYEDLRALFETQNSTLQEERRRLIDAQELIVDMKSSQRETDEMAHSAR